MTVLAATLPSNDGYVAAAYVVFFALLLVYLAIMGIRLSRMERKLKEMQEGVPGETGPGGGQAPEDARAPGGEPRQEELV